MMGALYPYVTVCQEVKTTPTARQLSGVSGDTGTLSQYISTAVQLYSGNTVRQQSRTAVQQCCAPISCAHNRNAIRVRISNIAASGRILVYSADYLRQVPFSSALRYVK